MTSFLNDCFLNFQLFFSFFHHDWRWFLKEFQTLNLFLWINFWAALKHFFPKTPHNNLGINWMCLFFFKFLFILIIPLHYLFFILFTASWMHFPEQKKLGTFCLKFYKDLNQHPMHCSLRLPLYTEKYSQNFVKFHMLLSSRCYNFSYQECHLLCLPMPLL